MTSCEIGLPYQSVNAKNSFKLWKPLLQNQEKKQNWIEIFGFGCLENVENLFSTITIMFTLTRSGSTCKGNI